MVQPFQQRVIDEKSELDTKVTKLKAFLESEQTASLDREDTDLLTEQSRLMSEYSEVLSKRIARFKNENRTDV